MGRYLVCTVGTSLLTNKDDRPWHGWSNGCPLPDAQKVIHWLAHADPQAASAETNTLHHVEIDENDRLFLLYTDTPESKFCARCLLEHYQQTQHLQHVELRQIAELGYHAHRFERGLHSLVDIVIRLVQEANNGQHPVILCATGGFKAEIAFLNLIGVLLGVEVVYIHEQFRELVRLPRLPLAWNTEVVVKNRDFFEWIDGEPRNSREVENWLSGRPELRPLVQSGGDGNTYLTAAGTLLWRAACEQHQLGPRAQWPAGDPRPPRDKNHVAATEHHRPDGWENFVDHLCRIDCVTAVRYDQAMHAGQRRIRILDENQGDIGVRYERGGQRLPLRVSTTARSAAQTQLVANYIENCIID